MHRGRRSGTQRKLREHINNIHKWPLVCDVEDCNHTKPFGRSKDLARHKQTAHDDSRPHTCPDKSCQAHAKGFSRKDKLKKHLKEKHRQVRCQRTHCSAVILEAEIESHIRQGHGDFECRLGPCRDSAPSNFADRDSLETHLRVHHKMNAWGILEALRGMTPGSTMLDHIVNGAEAKASQRCSVCAPQAMVETVADIDGGAAAAQS